MFISFRIKNYKSIIDLTLDLRYEEKKAPNGYKKLLNYPFFEKNNIRVVPAVSILGANATGKSNILKAINSFQNIVLNGIENNFCQNKINAKYETTTFELCFMIKNNVYKYILEYNNNYILQEILYKNNNIVFSCENNNLKNFETKSEIYTYKKVREIYNVECTNNKKQHIYTFISKLGKNFPNLETDITKVYDYIRTQISIYINNQIPFSYAIEELVKYHNSNEEEQLLRITNIIKKFDIDINSITYETKSVPINDFYEKEINLINDFYERKIDLKNNRFIYSVVNSFHKDINGNDVIFNFREESEGTKALAGIIGIILLTLDKGGILFVDELERSLHPLILIQLIRMFKDKEYNKKNAQLIFTTHNTDILESDLLRLSEIIIVNKTTSKGTIINKIASFENIRNTTNFRKRYLNGEFYGIPFPYI